MNNNNQQNATATAIASLAAATKTPFKTAFLAMLGVAAAQLFMFLGALVVIGGVIYIISM